FQAEDGIRDRNVTGVQTCALPILPLEDLIDEYAPNIKKLLEENPEIEKSITTTDGHIYALPQISEGHRSIWQSPIWYNGNWLDELGVDELPETTDEFYELLKR